MQAHPAAARMDEAGHLGDVRQDKPPEHGGGEVGGSEVFRANDPVEIHHTTIQLAPEVFHHPFGENLDGAGKVIRLLGCPHQVVLEGHQVGSQVGGVADGGHDQAVVADLRPGPGKVRGVIGCGLIGHAEGGVHIGGALAPVLESPDGVDSGRGLRHGTEIPFGCVADGGFPFKVLPGVCLCFHRHREIGTEKALLAGVAARGAAWIPVRDAVGFLPDTVHQGAVGGLVVIPVQAVAAGQFVGVDGHPVGSAAGEGGHQPPSAGPFCGGDGFGFRTHDAGARLMNACQPHSSPGAPTWQVAPAG